jgi:DNA topoisomerase IB
VKEPAVLRRIEQLAIPPAWREVWICGDERGHLQATGIDTAGRKQYLYHEQWRRHRDRLKFESMLEFARALPRVRARVADDLEGPELSAPRVLACAVRLLDLGFFRIGSEEYAERNGSYGLTTIRKEHVTVRDGCAVFDFTAKGGARRVQAIDDAVALEVVRALRRRRGGSDQLLAHRVGRHWHDVSADEVNQYLKGIARGDFSAKDFRTWNATVLAAVALAVDAPQAGSSSARRSAARAAIRSVANTLGNTPAVCRGSYVDPRVIDRYLAGSTIGHVLGAAGRDPDLDRPAVRRRIERAVIELLQD